VSDDGPLPAFGEPRVLQSGGRDPGYGNRLLLYEIEGRPALLKVYRRRRAVWRELARRFSYRFVEGRRGVTARQRRDQERTNLALWREQGFDVPALLDHPLPPALAGEVALWLEYCPGPLLSQQLADRARPLGERCASVQRFARELARRQRRALEASEPRLVMSHATAKHVLLHGDRQVSFDLEASYAPGTPLLDALCDELAGCLRSVLRAAPDERDALGRAFLAGYGDDALLQRLADHGLRGGLRRWLERRSDARRRAGLSEADALRWLRGVQRERPG
jgi:hypothetical protein